MTAPTATPAKASKPVQYRIANDAEFQGATVFIDGEPITVSGDNPEWSKIITLLVSGKATEDDLRPFIKPLVALDENLRRLGERVFVKGNMIYFDGDPIDNKLTDHILRVIHEGGKAYVPFVNLLEKIAQNPNDHSRDALYNFIEKNNITVLENGDLLMYKSTNADGTSTHAGYGIVDGVIFENAKLMNKPGSVIEIPRSKVDDNSGVHCSTGLHVGNYRYASTFSTLLWDIAVNPRDVVSVPNDGHEKIRVCRYVVIGHHKGAEYKGTVAPKSVKAPEPFKPGEADVAPKAEKPAKVKAAPVTTKAATTSVAADPKVAEFKLVISDLVKGGLAPARLSVYKNKKVTKGQRANFAEAARQLGYTA